MTRPTAAPDPTSHDEESGRVMLVEDDLTLRSMLETILRDEGFSVEGHTNGETALARLDLFDPDLILMDVGLPGMDGFELLGAVRQRSAIAVVMLTARVDSADVVRGLEAGADDYVEKPFDVEVLLARLRANLRRAPGGPDLSDAWELGDLRIEPRSGEVTVRGESVRLTRTELRVLTVLAAAGGDVVSREQLLSRVWRYDYLGDSRMVDAQVRRLRLKIEDDPSDPQVLLTVRGLGYRLVGADPSVTGSSSDR